MLDPLCEPGQLEEKPGPVTLSSALGTVCSEKEEWSLVFKRAGYLPQPQVALPASLMPAREFVLGRPGTCSSTEQWMPGYHALKTGAVHLAQSSRSLDGLPTLFCVCYLRLCFLCTS